MSFNGIVPILLQSVSPKESFSEGARKIASFIRKTEERFEAPEVINAILNSNINPKTLEYILFSFIDICQADFDVLEQVVPFRQLRRLICKSVQFPDALSDLERTISAQLYEQLQLATVDQVVAASRKAASLTLSLSQNNELSIDERMYLARLFSGEAAALKARTEWLSDHVDSYNMKAIARLLPLLTVCDEQICTLNDISNRIQRNDRLGRAVLTFEYAMRTDSFEKWKKKISRENSIAGFLEIIQMQRARLIPVRSIVAVATLSRRLHSADSKPLTWIRHALSCCTTDGFRMETGPDTAKIKGLLAACNIVHSGSLITGSFASGSLLQLTGTDMLTRSREDDEREPSPKELIARSISNDTLLLRLLENPKISGTPGLVAYIASTSRSLAVLQKIALTKELYSGHANSGVPLALLTNPSHIPITQLRQFINARYVSLVEMKGLLHNSYGIRREVFSEIKAFIAQHYK